MALEELTVKTHKQAMIIKFGMPGWGNHRGGAPTLSTAVGEAVRGGAQRKREAHTIHVAKKDSIMGSQRQEKPLPAGRSRRASSSREAAFEKGPEGWRNVPGKEEE